MKHLGSLLMVAGALLVLFYPALWVYGKVTQAYLHHQWRASASNGARAAHSNQVCRLVIPRIWVDQIVVEGVQDSQLAAGPGHFPETAKPGEGNCVIAGHLNTNGSPFRDLDQLHHDDLVQVETDQHLFEYRVDRMKVITPSDVDVLDPSDQPQLTLVTCMPGAKLRFAVFCRQTRKI